MMVLISVGEARVVYNNRAKKLRGCEEKSSDVIPYLKIHSISGALGWLDW